MVINVSDVRGFIFELSKNDNEIKKELEKFREGIISEEDVIINTMKIICEQNKKYKDEIIRYELSIW